MNKVVKKFLLKTIVLENRGLVDTSPCQIVKNKPWKGLYEEDKESDGKFWYSGKSVVHFTVLESICFFNLHIRGEYEIQSVKLTVNGEDATATFAINNDYEYLTIYPDFQILMLVTT